MVNGNLKGWVLAICVLPTLVFAQNNKKAAKDFFGKYRTQYSLDSLCQVSEPTLEDCHKVFIGTYADSFYLFHKRTPLHYTFDTTAASRKAAQTSAANKKYAYIKVETALVKDIVADKNTSFDVSDKVRDKLKPETELVKVNYEVKEGDKEGPSYKFWVLIGKRWVFFYKPARAFIMPQSKGKKKN